MNGAQNNNSEEHPRDRRNRLRRELYARRALKQRQSNNTADGSEDAQSRRNRLSRERRARAIAEQRQADIAVIFWICAFLLEVYV